jgi:phage FluMu gp28-like protein
LQDSGGVFRNVRQCSTVSREDYIYNPNHTYLLTADWGRSNDFSVFSVWDMDTYCQVELKRSNKVEYDEQREVLKDLYRGWHLCEENCRVEGNSIGHENAQQLRKDGYPVTEFYTNNERKSRWVDELAGSLEHQRIRLINDPVQIKELQSYERSSTPGEKFKYGAPTGQHDDTVITAMTANHYLKTEDWSDLSDTTTAAKTPERAELDAYNAEWAERMKSLREQTFPSNAVDDFLNEGVYA